MPVFKELLETKHMEPPAERTAEELQRSDKRASNKTKLVQTSVTAQTYNRGMVLTALVVGLIIILAAAIVIYLGVTGFIPSN